MNKWRLFIVGLLFLFSCKEENKKSIRIHPLKVIEAKGYIVPKDKIVELKTVPAGIPITVKAGQPKIISTNTNIHPAGVPKIILAGKPLFFTPGKDTFPLPKTTVAIDSPFVAGIPEVIIAKDMVNKDQNSQNFSSFNKLQGLKHGSIRCLLEDRLGNIWLGTNGGGVSKYDGKMFTHYTKKEGLSNNFVLSILEDRSGNLWFGTPHGVSKYDGKSFTHYAEKEGLSNYAVLTIVEDRSGDLWFGTDGGGVAKYNGRSFTHFTKKEGLSSNAIISMLEDKNGKLWFGTQYGVSMYDGKSFSLFTENEGLSNNIVSSMLEDRSGNLWFGTQHGLSMYDGRSFTHFTEKEGLSNNAVISILDDRSGNLWFGTNGGGVSKYDGTNFTYFTEKEGLSSNIVLSMLEDRSGNLWFGTLGGGMAKYGGKNFTHFTVKEGLNHNIIYSILQDRKGNLWFGTDGGGVSKYDGKKFSHYTQKEGLSNNSVISIMEDRSGNIWFGTDGGGVLKYDGVSFTNYTEKEGLCNNNVFDILEDRSGNLWFGTAGGGVSKYDGRSFTNIAEKEGLGNDVVFSIIEDRSGNLWFGTYGGGVVKYDGRSYTNFTEKEGLSNNVVVAILEDRSGNIWFGTNGGGVTKYDGKKFTHFTDKEGLLSNDVISILEDKTGDLWFGTRFGLSKLSKNKLTEIDQKVKLNTLSEEYVFFKNYNYDDGFLGIGCNRNSIYQANDTTIWIGATDRLTQYHPSQLVAYDKMPPNIQLTSIALFNENIVWQNLESKQDSTLLLGNGVSVSDYSFTGITKWYNLPENLSLAYNNNYLTFSFTGITMNQPKKVKYQYKLENIDENWSALSNRTEAPYGNLAHGNYTFKVKAMSSEGHWSKEFEYKFTIRPPFWKTLWFRILSGLIIVGSVWYYIKWRERKLETEKEKLEKIVEERTEELVQKNLVVEQQKQLVEVKHREITDSINYAERIQRSFLATKELLDENLKDYFVFFQPKDVVSGDFYWASKLNNFQFALVTADSTGHGVPGAIMSLLNITSLEKAIETTSEPSQILNATRKIIIERLKKDGSAEGGKDGMDCSLMSFNFKNKKLIYSAANNPVWIVRGNSILEFEPDKMPVGKHDRDTVSFTQHEIEIQKDDLVYAITDGMPDQFGGPKGKKFMYKKLKELLISISKEPMDVQKQKLVDALNDWKGDLEQVDDVTVIGVRV